MGGARRNVGNNASLAIVFRDDLDRLNTEDIYKLVYRNPPQNTGVCLRERLSCVLREHCGNDSVHNLQLRLVKTGHFDEDILSVDGNLRMVSVDDRRQRADSAIRVIDDGVDRRVPDNVQVFTQVLVFL